MPMAARVLWYITGAKHVSATLGHLNLLEVMMIMENIVLQRNWNRAAYNLVDATFRMDFAGEI
jgi:hypothetical protein